jgi:hypothetical protein
LKVCAYFCSEQKEKGYENEKDNGYLPVGNRFFAECLGTG